jgi:KaiC/GvpD/RAD55 family RecA-like ATPase/CheY-like chemotaxis protein
MNGQNESQTQRTMENVAKSQAHYGDGEAGPELLVLPGAANGQPGIPSGIARLDERIGGLEKGGIYLFAGPPGPAKLVATLQFLRAGIEAGERVMLLAGGDASGILEVAQAWGSPLEKAWREGRLDVVGFRDDFEMRVLRSPEPEEALEELDGLASRNLARIAVESGSVFFQGGARTLLGRAFLEWARRHPATVCATLSVDTGDTLPASAEWLVHATSGVFLMDRRPDGLFQVRLNRAFPGAPGADDPVTLQLTPGKGLMAPARFPSRRQSDRPSGDAGRLLLVSLGEGGSSEMEAWAKQAFRTEVVGEPLEAVAKVQADAGFGGILLHAPRRQVRQAVHVCRAIRPLTGAAILVASDDAIRSTDRIQLLEAGADDCLTGGVDFRELGARLRQAASAGGKMASAVELVPDRSHAPSGGMVARSILVKEALRRASDPSLTVFSMVRLALAGTHPSQGERILAEAIREEEGDLAFCGPDECLVLLQGARRDPARAFLARIQEILKGSVGGEPKLLSEILVHPVEGDRIDALFAGSLEPLHRKTAPEAPGGPGVREI